MFSPTVFASSRTGSENVFWHQLESNVQLSLILTEKDDEPNLDTVKMANTSYLQTASRIFIQARCQKDRCISTERKRGEILNTVNF